MAERETCVLFVDGLRYDIGGALKEKLEALGLKRPAQPSHITVANCNRDRETPG